MNISRFTVTVLNTAMAATSFCISVMADQAVRYALTNCVFNMETNEMVFYDYQEMVLDDVVVYEPPQFAFQVEDCSICLSGYDVGSFGAAIVDCGHYFHYNCLRQWMNQSMTCPLRQGHIWPLNSTVILFGRLMIEYFLANQGQLPVLQL